MSVTSSVWEEAHFSCGHVLGRRCLWEGCGVHSDKGQASGDGTWEASDRQLVSSSERPSQSSRKVRRPFSHVPRLP